MGTKVAARIVTGAFPEEALGKVLEFPHLAPGAPPEGMAETYDLVRLIGAVAGQIVLLDVATGAGDPKARVTAARALLKLGEKPEQIVERLNSSAFRGLTSADLHAMVQQIRNGKDPRAAVQEAVQRKTTTRRS